MKQTRTLCLAASAVALFVTQAAMAVTPPNPKDLTQGKWELQVDKSKFCNPGPSKSVREIFDAGWDVVSIHWTGTDAKGAPINSRYVYKYDGKKYPSDITKPTDVSISWKLVSPSKVEFIDWSKDDKMIAENVRSVSADGQTMTQTTTANGAKCTDSQVFARK